MNKPYEGLFLTIEGGDGCGKSTLTEKLAQALTEKGYDVVKTREPGGSPLSEKIRALVLTPPPEVTIGETAELLLFLTSRVQHLEELILPALRQRKVVLCERFNDSTIAYQGGARHLGVSHVEKLCSLVCAGVEPDCTLFLDLDPEVGLRRLQGDEDRLEQERLQFHREVRQAFLHLADTHDKRIEVIDATLSPDGVLAAALKALEPHLMLKPTRK